jgi:alpha-beta hydrolase superfamily lysophospholipase
MTLPAHRGFRSRFFSVSISLVSGGLMTRDRLLRVTRRLRKDAAREEFFFASGTRKLAGVWVGAGDGAPVILLCHGIGETVGHWSAVQAYLSERGVGSLVFNYSGYGASSGRVSAEHCDEDLASAYTELRRRVGPERRVFVLGFSLGSGIAASGVGALEPAPAGLFLCEAFPSFREAVRVMGFPFWVARAFPDIWNTAEAVTRLSLAVCVVHSDGDRLFPVEMARRIASACGERGELVVASGLTHNEPYLRPTDAYWGPIVERVLGAGDRVQGLIARRPRRESGQRPD